MNPWFSSASWLIALSGVLINTGVNAQSRETVVRIAHVAPLTGQQAHYGKDNEAGARMAIEDLNKRNLILDGARARFELVAEDDAADPKQGTTVAQKLCDMKVNGVVGHLNSGTTFPASKIYAECGIPEVTPSATTPKLTQQGFKSLFRVIAKDDMLGLALGNYAVKNLKAKRIVAIDDRTNYGQPLADIFTNSVRQAGGKVVERHYTNDKSNDFTAILMAAKAKNPDLIFYGGMDAQAGPLLRQMKQLGLTATLLGGDGICTAELVRLGGDNVGKNVICAEGGMALSKMPGGPAFEKRYKETFKTEIQVYAPFVYDATMVIGLAMEKARSADPKKYLPFMEKTQFDGVIGPIAFDSRGDIKNGSITLNTYDAGKKAPLAVLK
ncbi:MAG: branched-chain amino acid ABC transporter substrate-binding protein [Burkholderiaceae bacterium]|jgi:branched-chain amino acid transport system substrate-binding protein